MILESNECQIRLNYLKISMNHITERLEIVLGSYWDIETSKSQKISFNFRTQKSQNPGTFKTTL